MLWKNSQSYVIRLTWQEIFDQYGIGNIPKTPATLVGSLGRNSKAWVSPNFEVDKNLATPASELGAK